MAECPCGGGDYGACCEPLIGGVRSPATPEALMRSRYSAFVKGAVDYILETTHPQMRPQLKREAIASWSRKADWLGLDILDAQGGQGGDTSATVEFIARYREKGRKVQHHEVAQFRMWEGAWYFYDGEPPKTVQMVRNGPKIGRNDPCSCGSGKKFKKCCGA